MEETAAPSKIDSLANDFEIQYLEPEDLDAIDITVKSGTNDHNYPEEEKGKLIAFGNVMKRSRVRADDINDLNFAYRVRQRYDEIYKEKLSSGTAKLGVDIIDQESLDEAVKQERDEENIRKLRSLAYTDAVTTLANRNSLAEYNKNHPTNKTRYDIDLSGFKRINDTLGHDVGDRALYAIGRRLQSVVRQADSISFNSEAVRTGGDEFVVVVATEDKNATLRIANEIQKCFLRPLSSHGKVFRVDGRVGMAYRSNYNSDKDWAEAGDTNQVALRDQIQKAGEKTR